jgi:phospholipid/cholesterol/gamma-HCH transport system substrate-binding protein
MNERVMQFRVGVVVLFTAIIGGLLVTLNSPAPKVLGLLGKGTYLVMIATDSAPGVGQDTPVRKNGILVGRVASVEGTDAGVEIGVNVNEGTRLFPQHKAEVRTSMLGDATIELVLDRPIPEGTAMLPPGAEIPGKDVGNPLDALGKLEGNLRETIDSLGQAGDEVRALAKRVNEAFDDQAQKGRVSRLLDETEAALGKFNQAADSVDRFFNDPNLHELSREGRLTMQDVRQAADNISEMSQLGSQNLRNLEGFTKPLGRNGEQIASSIIKALDGLGRIVEELTVLSDALNNREGTIGQLIHNPAVYDNLNRVLLNGNHVVLRFNDLTKRLQVVVEDARVFMDKIAREPGRIVGGALNTGPGIK